MPDHSLTPAPTRPNPSTVPPMITRPYPRIDPPIVESGYPGTIKAAPMIHSTAVQRGNLFACHELIPSKRKPGNRVKPVNGPSTPGTPTSCPLPGNQDCARETQ